MHVACVLMLLPALVASCRWNFDPVLGDGSIAMDGVPLDVQPRVANLAFITTTTYTGALGGTAGADTLCNDEARMHGMQGTFIALLRSSTRPDLEAALQGSRGWQLVDGTWLADTPTQVAAGDFLQPLRLKADGQLVAFLAEFRVWTGVNGSTCSDWTSAAPAATGDQHWIPQWQRLSDGDITCDSKLSLACFEVGNSVAYTPPPITNKRIFVSSADIDTTAGIASADQLCAMDAQLAGLGGTFLAMLPPDSATAALDRFPDGRNTEYQRLDGFVISTLFFQRAYVLFGADGQVQNRLVWTSGDPRTATTDTCGDWSTNSGVAVYGSPLDWLPFEDGGNTQSCGANAGVFCAEL